MPSYQLIFDREGQPCLEEEFSGDFPDESWRPSACRRAIQKNGSTIDAETAGRSDARGPFASGSGLALCCGANDAATSSANDSLRPAPFSFG